MATAAERIRACYPKEASASVFEYPADLLSTERVPPPNPLLHKEYVNIGVASVVRAEPAAVHFSGIESDGRTLVATLRLINMSSHPIRMHILPPMTSFFTMSIHKRGRVMPGLAEEVIIRCTPNGVRYYHDTIKVYLGDSDDQLLLVPIHAYPAVEVPLVPKSVDFGLVPQGQSVRQVLPLRSSDGAEFEFRVDVIQTHADFVIQPLAGVIPAYGQVGIVVDFTPSRLATVHGMIQIHISQLNLAPQTVTLIGSSAPHQVKELTLARLHAEDEERCRAGGSAGSEGFNGGNKELLGGMDYGDAAGQARGDPTDNASTSVMVKKPAEALVAYVATKVAGGAGGGGSAGGDYVTRAMHAQLREKIGSQSVPVVYPKPRPPDVEESKEGLRVPPHLNNQHAVNSM